MHARRRGLSINQKLIGLIGILMTVVVSVLTAYFSYRQIAELTADLVHRAETYGALFSGQLAPAVAFEDHETAREVFKSLTVDDDVQSAVLCNGRGRVLYAAGSASGSVCAAFARSAPRGGTLVDDARVAVVTPIATPEGPRGTLIIELSTSRLLRDRHLITVAALTVGGLVLLGGMLVTWFIARSFTHRLRRMVDLAVGVTSGALDQAPLPDKSGDEIGILANAFDAMLVRLRGLIANVQDMAKREQNALSEANAMLERRVDERTTELCQANKRLVKEIADRNQIEIELRQAQKLEAVGRLAAGVAHEINTPIQFINDSVHFVRDATQDLLGAARVFQTLYRQVLDNQPWPAILRAAEDAERATERADLPYLVENVPLALDRAAEGLSRVATIVRSMKEFAHPDQKEMAAVDLNRAIESTLVISRNEYKVVADVETNLGDIPRVVCHASEINQALLNIVINAAHAIGDVVRNTDRRGRITVRSWQDGGDVVISVADTGGGIPEAIRGRIFDPFFTTKEVGRGTGQGLAISRSVIVDKHAGQLTFETTLGKGTTFFIRLPAARAIAA